jgi:hypothetical protein
LFSKIYDSLNKVQFVDSEDSTFFYPYECVDRNGKSDNPDFVDTNVMICFCRKVEVILANFVNSIKFFKKNRKVKVEEED